MKNLLLSSLFFVVIGLGLAQASSDTDKKSKEPANTETTTEAVKTVEEPAEDTVIEIRINGESTDVAGIMDMTWKTILLVIFTIVILILVVRTLRGKASA